MSSDLLLDWESSAAAAGGGDEEDNQPKLAGKEISTDAGDRSELDQYLKEFDERQKSKQQLREKNLEAANQRPDESFFTKLDSNLKKNTNFVKKLKTFSESQKESLMKDFKTLNLSRYIAEIASNLCEAKLKMSDIPAMVEFCSVLHQRYAEFSSNFMDSFKKSFPSFTKSKLVDAEKTSLVTNPSKFRVDLRLLAELIVIGVLPEKESLIILGSTLKYLSSNPGGDHRHLSLIITFLRFCGDDYAGLVPRRIRLQCENFHVPIDRLRSQLMNGDRQKTVRNIFVEYYRDLSEKYFTKLFRELKQIERQNRRQYETKGEIHPESQQRFEEIKSTYEKLQQNVLQLADIVDMDPPELPELPSVDEVEGGGESAGGGLIVGGGMFEKVDVAGGLWEDEDTRMFYETLPELRAMLPGILFKESEQATLAPVEEKIDEVKVTEEEAQQTSGEDTTKDAANVQEPMEETPEPEDIGKADMAEDEEDTSTSAAGAGAASGGGGAVTGSMMKQIMDAFVAQLPNTINRDLIDRAAIDFVTNLNTKPNRKRLVKALFNVQRNRQDLLPFYGRLVAVLKPVMPDVSTELVRMLIADFRYQLRKKDQVYVESKVKVVRFIGELVKFKIFPKSEALHCLKTLLYDFRHHNIDMACALLDSCGRFMYFSPDSHQKTKLLLEQMERKSKAAAYLDQRYQLMVENALATCKPDAGVAQKEKIELPTWQQYMNKLIFKDLNKSTVEKVLKQMRKFNWDDPNIASHAIVCLSQPWLLKFSCIQWMASLVAGLMFYYDYVGHQVVDNILEEIRLGMEVNHLKFNQRRLCCVKYLAEMYNYRVVDSPIIFNTLYSLITFGVSFDPNVPSPLDPPEHLFRIRLSCTILETCGEYFDRGLAKKKLDCFLTYLQRYYWYKKRASCWNDEYPFPLEVDNLLKDTMEFLRPDTKIYKKCEDAENAVKKIEDEYREKAESALKFVQPSDDQQRQGAGDEEWEDERGPLRPIAEGEEDEYAEAGGRIGESQDSASQTQGGPGGESLNSQGGGADWRGHSKDRDTDEDPRRSGDEFTGDGQYRVYRSEAHADPDDDEFTAAFDRLMVESIQQRMQETIKPSAVEIPLPTNVRTKLTARAHFEGENEPEKPAQEGEFVNFVLLTKGKGGVSGKPAMKTIKVLANSDLATLVKSREEEEQLEKERVKQLTLNISRRMQQEEEMAEMADLQKKVTENLAPKPYGKIQQQQQRSGYQHQRGAPGPHEAFSKSWQKH